MDPGGTRSRNLAPDHSTAPAPRAEWLRAVRQHLDLPTVLRAYQHTVRGEARELIELDPPGSAAASDARRELDRLRPLRRERVLERYRAAVESGRAQGRRPVVAGMIMGLFGLGLRQGMLDYARRELARHEKARSEADGNAALAQARREIERLVSELTPASGVNNRNLS